MRSLRTFPTLADAPWSLWKDPGNCGLVTAWAVLRHFRRRVDSRRLAAECRWSETDGTFLIALAVALHGHGLDVVFHTDPDPAPHRIERACYLRAAKLGIPVRPALGLEDVLCRLPRGWLPVVLYDTAQGNGHVSPLLGRAGRSLQLPFDDEGQLSTRTFLRRWRAPGVLRQCILARRPDDA